MTMLDPDHNERNQPQGAVAGRPFVVAGGQAAVLLAAVDQPLHAVPQPVDRPVEGPRAAFVAPPRNGVPKAPPATVRAARAAGVALVAHDPLGPDAGPPAARTPHRARLQQWRESGRLMPLPRREHQRHRFATALDAQVDLGREAALAAPEGFRRRGPPFAPAACWCARITVPSTKCNSQSNLPAASACCWTAAKSWAHTPAWVQRRKRVYTVCQGPYRSGRSRHGTPVASFHRMPLRIRRSSWRGRPGFRGGSSGCNRAHSLSLNSCRRRILPLL